MSQNASLFPPHAAPDSTQYPQEPFLFFGVDETGFFPANYNPDPQACRSPRMRRMAADGTLRKMIININASNDPEDVRHRSTSTEHLSKHRNRQELEPYNGYRWAEINGVHSRQPELVGNPFRTRKAATAYALMACGFTGLYGQQAIIDPFWNFSDEAVSTRELQEFLRAFEFFGIHSGVSIPEEADMRYKIVQRADANAYRVFAEPRRDKMYTDRKIELPPEVLLDCVRSMKAH